VESDYSSSGSLASSPGEATRPGKTITLLLVELGHENAANLTFAADIRLPIILSV